MRINQWIFLALFSAVFFAGCGEGSHDVKAVARPPTKLREVKVTLHGYAGPEEAGIFMAQQRRFFSAAGLRLWTGAPISPNNSVRYAATGVDDFGVAPLAQVVTERENGVPIVAIGSLISRPTVAMIWLRRSKIRSVADLKGKTIAVPGITYQEGFLKSLLARASLTLADVRVKIVGYHLVPALLSGRADAVFGGSANIQGVELRSRGAKPVVVGSQALGLPACEELVVVAGSRFVDRNPRLVRRFMAAVTHGATSAVEDPKGALAAVANAPEANPATSPEASEEQGEETIPLLSTTGHIRPRRARCLERWMHRHGLIQKEPLVSELVTNRYLP